MYKDNPEFELKASSGKYRVYTLVNLMEMHTTRFVELTDQQIYAASGATPETIQAVCDAGISLCNDTIPNETLKTDIAQLLNSLKYRLQHPVDQHCSLRMGATASFIEYDDVREVPDPANPTGPPIKEPYTVTEPLVYNSFYREMKVRLAMENPDLYTFFLSWGVALGDKYKSHYHSLTDPDYFSKRAETIRTVLPARFRDESKMYAP